ncbi:MAG: potassium transporter Kup [Alphaproteobacteria bacterium]|nr:potassium transporter Kup [Alphaproteobacteria bacterium]MBV9064074.1 potassium transporter Kup [Alphaproteobacteria bacterium]
MAGEQAVGASGRDASAATVSPTSARLADGIGSRRAGFKRNASLTLAALGVVYGDIGTSPLYAVRESALAAGGHTPSAAAVLGVISLIFWSLIIVVTLKYVVLIMQADNDGEGGILALSALAHRTPGLSRRSKLAITTVAILGLALFFGDGMLTPAISVLSAVEGLSVESPGLAPLVMPLSLAILIGLFVLQSRGTQLVGSLFGPVITVWFITIAALGLVSILKAPQIVAAIDPYYGIALFLREPWTAFVSLGSVVLAVTGCETLYADIGHFGKFPIRLAWLCFVLPALLLTYFGQGAALLLNPHKTPIAFYAVAPHWAHYPLVFLATIATIIASQAVISGVFSLSKQAVQLGQLPRMEIRHTSATEYGQIYVPGMNALLAVGVALIVLIFRSSGALATAYGIAVTGIMVLSTILVAVVAVRQWRWRLWLVLPVFGVLALIDLFFLGSNALKIVEGGWLPLAIAVATFVIMDTWRLGRRAHLEKVRQGSLPIDLLLARAEKLSQRVSGTAIFMNVRSDVAPAALLHSIKHYKVIHERVVLMTVYFEEKPFVSDRNRLEVIKLGKGFFEVKIRFGFFETPDVAKALELARSHGLALDADTSTFFLGRETLVPSSAPTLPRWRIALYMWLASNALSPAKYFCLPPNRVVELGAQVAI